MPTPSSLSNANFIQTYSNYQNAVSYAQQWTTQIVAMVTALQSDPNFQADLSPTEQAALQTVTAAATAFLQAVPIPTPTPVPPPSNGVSP